MRKPQNKHGPPGKRGNFTRRLQDGQEAQKTGISARRKLSACCPANPEQDRLCLVFRTPAGGPVNSG